MSQRPIQIMSNDLAQKIAAGEVVDRPAAAVKELLDNAIDAESRSIKVEVQDAGLKLIRVTDDGLGIPRSQLPLAFASHATSKIESLDDLEHLGTLGFRGEALPSIAAVSRVDVQARIDDEATGTRYIVEYGEPQMETTCSAPRGLRISVSNLFSNVPARRKFVRSLRAEAGQIQNVVMHYALAQPAIQITLSIDGRETFHAPGTGLLQDAFAAVHGADALRRMIAINATHGSVHVEGLMSAPALSRQNRSAITIFVNGRPIANRSLIFALEEAYSGFLMTGRHPIAALHLWLPSSEVDVNVHPAKSEVRFAHEREVHGALHHTAADALFQLRLEARSLQTGPDERLDASAPEAHTLFAEEHVDPASDPPPLLSGLPALRVFGQAHATFIVAEGPDGVYMIDQHAAHERVLFDRLDQETFSGQVSSQQLLQPEVLSLTPEQMAALDTNLDLLARLGFDIEPFGDQACLLRAIPVLARAASPQELVMEVLEELRAAPEPGAARDRALAALACKAAVKAGDMLDVQEMRELVIQLERTLRPSTCPHGRPTMIHLSQSQLEREFGRR